ncbi:MAG: TIGR00282 family metallophosphoesterase [Alphaproteobacteria bacterium]|nr:TIGR00282 family metallophosphoesterase [Alphaproteobacteria bacterium]
MRILFLGDVVGKSGRHLVAERLPDFRRRYYVDFTIVNGDNAAHGFGLSLSVCRELFNAGADVITSGNHGWIAKEIQPILDTENRLLRPANYPAGTPGKGAGLYRLPDGRKVGVLHVQGRVFMDAIENPFSVAKQWTDAVRLGKDAQAMIVDIHGEATSEKMALGQFLDGSVSLVVGSHTHVPTADAQILPNGTAYLTDAGMCGCFDSVIGMKKEEPVRRFVTNVAHEKYEPEKGEATLCGVMVDTNDAAGLAEKIYMIRCGGRLQESLPPL